LVGTASFSLVKHGNVALIVGRESFYALDTRGWHIEPRIERACRKRRGG